MFQKCQQQNILSWLCCFFLICWMFLLSLLECRSRCQGGLWPVNTDLFVLHPCAQTELLANSLGHRAETSPASRPGIPRPWKRLCPPPRPVTHGSALAQPLALRHWVILGCSSASAIPAESRVQRDPRCTSALSSCIFPTEQVCLLAEPQALGAWETDRGTPGRALT